MNNDNPMNTLNCQVNGSFHFFIIHQEKASPKQPTIVTEMPLNIGLVFEKTKKAVPFGSIKIIVTQGD